MDQPVESTSRSLERILANISEKDEIAMFVEHLVAYTTGTEDHLSPLVLRQSRLTVSIGKAVQVYMSQLSQTQYADIIMELVLVGHSNNTSRFVTFMSTYLSRFVPHHCFFFLATVCEICIQSKAVGDEDLVENVKSTAIDGMMMFLHWWSQEIYKKLDESAKELLAAGIVDLRLNAL